MLDKYSNRSRGFGFVSFTDVEACNAARDAMNGKVKPHLQAGCAEHATFC